MLLGHVDAAGVARGSWTDSWHLRDALMACEGRSGEDGFAVTGAYAAPPGPDWRWRTSLTPSGADGLRLEMVNIDPDGAEALAVRCDYARVAAPVGALDLGAFSVSLTVADLGASEAFYAALGFARVMGDRATGWLILRNGAVTIGLFHGMFERNVLTFNPGWTADAAPRLAFTDVRDLQAALKRAGVAFAVETPADADGPGSFVVVDPDGNPVLFDQHVGRGG